MKVLNINAPDLVKNKNKFEKDVNNLDKQIKDKINCQEYIILFCLNDSEDIIGSLVYRIHKKYIIIESINKNNNYNLDEIVKILLDSVRKRKAYLKLKWIRMWLFQNLENVPLCKSLCKYGFYPFPDKNDMTRFAFKESFINPK